MSPRYKEMLGYTDEEFPNVRESWLKSVYPEDLEPAWTALKRLIKGKADHVEHEFRMVHKDGSLRWILARGTCVKNDDGRVHRIVGTHTDITDRKLAEARVAESEERYRLLTEHASSAVTMHEIVLDEAGRPVDFVFLSANPAFEAHTGLKPADVVGRRATEVIPGIKNTQLIETFGQVMRSGEPISFEQYYPPLGRYFLASAYKVSETRFASIFTDITKQKNAELALKQERDLFTAGPVFIASTKSLEPGQLTFVSENVFHILGYTPAEMTAESFHFADLIHPEDLPWVFEEVKKYIESGVVNFELSFRIRNRSGDYRWFNDFTQLIRNDSSDVTAINSYMFDQTEQRQAEAALRLSEQKARAILDTSFQLFGMLDLEGNLIDVNQTALNLDGLPKSEVLGKPLWETPSWAYSSELQDRLRAAIKTAASGESVQFEVTHPTPDGQKEYVEFSLRPVKDDDGKVLFLIPEGHAVTDRKLAEEKLAAEHNRLTSIIEGTRVGTWSGTYRQARRCSTKSGLR